MEDRETLRMCKCGESKMTRIMMESVPHVISGSGWWNLYRTSFPVRDLENFRPIDFCWTERTLQNITKYNMPPKTRIS